MKNVVVCKNCSSENPFFALICYNCKSYLRERIYNIDLWKIIGLLIEAPSKAFRTIIFSEHKNFLILLFILVSGKIFLNGIYLTIFFRKWNASFSNYFTGYIIILIFTVIMILIYTGALGEITKKLSVKTRFKDNFSILIYSFLPYVFGFLILFPLELILFGEYLFYYDPSPFLLKGAIAYILLGFELLIILWCFFLTSSAINVQTNKITYSLMIAFFIHFSFYIIFYFISSGIFI